MAIATDATAASGAVNDETTDGGEVSVVAQMNKADYATLLAGARVRQGCLPKPSSSRPLEKAPSSLANGTRAIES